MLRTLSLLFYCTLSLWSGELKLDWYSWNGFSDYKKENLIFFTKLPPTKRIFLSFSAKEILLLKKSLDEERALKEFFYDAKQNNVRIDLLLGDATFIYPKNHEKLLTLIDFFKKYAFKGIHLDIEPSALPKEEYSLWRKQIIQLSKKVKQHNSTLHLGLSLNHKIATHSLLQELQKAGIDEAVIMYYTINQKKVINKVQNILKNNQKLDIALALSIEPLKVLSADETYAIYGKEKSLQKWQSILNKLSSNHNFSALVIQSLKDFNKAKE
jgi:hypothetical protein